MIATARALLDAALGRREADAGAGRGGDEHGLAREQPVAAGRILGLIRHFGSFGNPNARSPMTFRWIWFEPP